MDIEKILQLQKIQKIIFIINSFVLIPFYVFLCYSNVKCSFNDDLFTTFTFAGMAVVIVMSFILYHQERKTKNDVQLLSDSIELENSVNSNFGTSLIAIVCSLLITIFIIVTIFNYNIDILKCSNLKKTLPTPIAVENLKLPDTATTQNVAPPPEALNDNPHPDFSAYMSNMSKKIKKNWNPPKDDVSRRVVLKYTVNRKGEILNVSVIESSGRKETDETAIKALKASAPFGGLPKEFTGQTVDIQFTFDYNVFVGGQKTTAPTQSNSNYKQEKFQSNKQEESKESHQIFSVPTL